jgi:hypothetical protein
MGFREGGAAEVARVGLDVDSAVPTDACMGKAAVQGDLPTVQWLHAEGFRLSEEAVWTHGCAVSLVVRKWLLANS